MKTAWNIIAIVALLNLLVLLGFVGWMYQSGRLNEERYRAAVAMFSPTLDEEIKAKDEERKKEEVLRVEQEKVAHLKRVEQGPVTLLDRLSADQQIDELAMHKLARLQSEIIDLRRGLDSQNRQLAMERQKLTDDRKAYADYLSKRKAMLESEDFRRVIDTLEQLKAPHAKQMMQELAANGGVDQVVEYLAAMDLRKRASLLREFKTPREVSNATMLLEKMRVMQTEHAAMASKNQNAVDNEPGSNG